MFTPGDKGNVTVCLKTGVYNEQIFNLLFDTSTYKTVNYNPLKSYKTQPLKFLKI